MNQYKIFFDKYQEFELRNIRPLMGICGLYCIFLKETEIPYPFWRVFLCAISAENTYQRNITIVLKK
jgi:hypothetical protein